MAYLVTVSDKGSFPDCSLDSEFSDSILTDNNDNNNKLIFKQGNFRDNVHAQ